MDLALLPWCLPVPNHAVERMRENYAVSGTDALRRWPYRPWTFVCERDEWSPSLVSSVDPELSFRWESSIRGRWLLCCRGEHAYKPRRCSSYVGFSIPRVGVRRWRTADKAEKQCAQKSMAAQVRLSLYWSAVGRQVQCTRCHERSSRPLELPVRFPS